MAQNFLSQIYANHGIRIDDALQDGTGLPGTAGQILSSNATGVSWIDPSALPAGAAETVEIQVKNTSGGILTKGTPVYIKPSTSAIDRVEVAAADAGDSTKMPAVGLLAQDLNNQATGVAITGGMLTNFTTDPIDGSTPTSNDTVYVKVGGGLTLTKPTGATGLIQNIAKVGKVSGGNSGSLVVSSILRTNDVPNLPTGRIWVGDGNSIASTVVFIDETNGFFGINNATPTAQLDVTGQVNFEDLKLDGELLDQFNSPGANGMILQSLKLGPTNQQGINWVSAGQIVVTGIQENNNTAFIDVTASGLGAGYVTGPVTISAELSAGGTPTSANFLRGDNTWATAVTGLTVGNSNFIDLSNVGTATVPDITATLSASGTPLATNFLSGDNTWKQIEIASGNTNTLTVAFTNKNVLTVQTPGVGAATFGLATGKQIYDYIAGLTVNDLSPPTADFDVNNNKILNLTTPTLADDAANKAYVDNVLAGSGALIYQGGYNASTNTPDLTSSPNSIIQGWTYAVTVAGDASGFWSPSLNIGDLVIANVDNPTSISEWTEVQANIDVATAGTSVTSVKGIAGFNEDDFTAVNGFVSVKDDTYVPYTGATTDVDLGANNLIVDTDTLFVDSSNNRVGIRTSSPNADLDILNGVTGASLKLSATSTAYWQIQRDSITGNLNISDDALGNVMSFDQLTGNAGIGTDSPLNKFVVAEGTNQHGIEFAPGATSYIQAYDRATSDYGDLKIDAQILVFGTDNGSERMRIDSSGNVGIKGTGTKLGWERASDNSANIVYLTKNEDLGVNGNAKLHGYDGIIFSTEGSETPKMTINSSGNVGIGVVPSNAKLDVKTTGNQAIYAITDGGWNGLEFTSDNGTTIGALNAYNGLVKIGTTNGFGGVTGAINIDSSGNVGIGKTAASGYKLDIEANNQRSRLLGTTGYVAAEVTNNGGAFTMGKENSSGGGFMPTTGAYDSFLISQGAVNLLFGTNNTERMRITSAGAIHLSQGTGNAFVGTNAGNLGTSTGTYNSGFGNSSLFSNTTGGSNTANGYASLYNNTEGSFNTANGRSSLIFNTTGDNNTANGYAALYSNTTGNNNTANGRDALYSNTTGVENTAVGRFSLYANTTGASNTASGYAALYQNTDGDNNTAIGYTALENNTTGNYNTANGASALYSNTTGVENTATGYQALDSNTTGNYNTANGAYALQANTTASQNTAYGYAALYLNTTGRRNTATGYQALFNNTEGNYNTATGYSALFNNTTGISNTAYGYSALSANTTASDSVGIGYATLLISTGGQNTSIGNYALSATTTGVNNTGVGYNAQASSATVSNEITLGNGNVTTLRCNTQTISSLSDIRDKKDVKELQGAEAFIKELKPVSFVWNQRDGGRVDIDDNGFIAQDLIEAQEKSGHKIPNLVLENNPEKLEAAYGAMLPTIVSALQSALKEIDLLKTEIETLKNK